MCDNYENEFTEIETQFSNSYAPPSQFADTIEEARKYVETGDYWVFDTYESDGKIYGRARGATLEDSEDKFLGVVSPETLEKVFGTRTPDILDVIFAPFFLHGKH